MQASGKRLRKLLTDQHQKHAATSAISVKRNLKHKTNVVVSGCTVCYRIVAH